MNFASRLTPRQPWPATVMGLDLSLTGTGIALLRAGDTRPLLMRTVKPGKLTGTDRMRVILDAITEAQRAAVHVDLAVIEGPSYGSQNGQRGHHERGGLWWQVVCGLAWSGQPYAIMPPTNRAKYATGRGGAPKAVVLAAVAQTYGVQPADDNQADAYAMAAAGLDHLGVPLAELPATHRDALRGCQWPALPSDE